ncbi:ROK family transcriptional regulator [Brachybacterium paraconglomeratum]|uniref:ROK family transcriptional regulator n=4 Tax=Dermabacteraceae TaxID=85020 RepID=A0A426SFU8_9MICO|nr:ROK family transcriptional regulator [Brachybacterium paraconglomeratum]
MSMVTPPAANGAQGSKRLQSVVRALLEHGTMSRTELAALTGYSQSSMTGSIRMLMRLGHVMETGRGRSTGGRRRTMLEFDRRSVLLMLISVDSGHLVARQVDLSGTVHVQVRRRLDPERPLASVLNAIDALQGAAESPSTCAIISLPGVVSAEGDVSLAPALGQPTDRRLQDVVAEASGLHTIGENDVNLLALGEAVGGAAQDVKDFGLIFVGDGIGGALVLDGRVHRGVSGSAGEIGFLPWNGTPSSGGSAFGPLESNWSVSALRSKAEDIGIDAAETNVVEALEGSDMPEARVLLDAAMDAWAYAGIVLTCVINPGRVVFAGGAVHLSVSSRAALSAKVLAGSPSPIEVCFAELGDGAIVNGAISHLQSAPWIFLPEDEEHPDPHRSTAGPDKEPPEELLS